MLLLYKEAEIAENLTRLVDTFDQGVTEYQESKKRLFTSTAKHCKTASK
jgi:hypothetical protein